MNGFKGKIVFVTDAQLRDLADVIGIPLLALMGTSVGLFIASVTMVCLGGVFMFPALLALTLSSGCMTLVTATLVVKDFLRRRRRLAALSSQGGLARATKRLRAI